MTPPDAKLAGELRDIADSQFGPSEKQRQLFRNAAERIEKLERENETLNIRVNAREEVLDRIRSQLIGLGFGADTHTIPTAISDLTQERDTALRALAEARRDAAYRLWKLELVIPLFQEARDALTALTVQQIRLHGIRSDLASRMDYAGTADVEQYLEAVAARQPEKDANNG